jgi:class 3 adenylate cyclase
MAACLADCWIAAVRRFERIRGEVAVKGIERPVRLFEVRWVDA